MADLMKYAQVQKFTLAGAGVSLGDSSMTLSSFKDIDGNLLTMADFGAQGFGTVEPGSNEQEEQIVFTGVTQNTDGTATLTGIKNVEFLAPYTQTANFLKSHAGGVTFIISNTSGFYDTFANKQDDEDITGVSWTVDDPTSGRQIANKEYVDAAVQSGTGSGNQIATRAYKSAATQSIPTGVATKITLDAENFDTGTNFAASTYTATVPGYYQVNASLEFLATEDQALYKVLVYKNGSAISAGAQNGGTDDIQITCADVIQLEIGDTLELYAFQNGAGSATAGNGIDSTYLSVVFASATGIAAVSKAYLGAGVQTITPSTPTKVLLDQTSFNVGNGFDTATNRFIAPNDGYYQVNASVYYTGASLQIQPIVPYFAYVYKNGVKVLDTLNYDEGTLDNSDLQCAISDIIQLAAGDVLELYAEQRSSGNKEIFNSANTTFMSVVLTSLGSGTGGGDVTGPASSIDNAVVRFNGTTGKLLQNSNFVINDLSGNEIIVGPANIAGTGTKMQYAGGQSTNGGDGGDAEYHAGDGITGSANGGDTLIRGGDGAVMGDGGTMTVRGGTGGATSGDGGALILDGGSALSGSGGNGGGVGIAPGAGDGAGTHGDLILYKKSPGTVGEGAIMDMDSLSTTNKRFVWPNQNGQITTATLDSAPPATTPVAIGQIFIDTSGPDIYISVDTSSAADWIQVN